MTDRRADPSPEQISERCAEIRQSWTAEEHFRRMRPDMRPEYRLADGEYQEISAADYEAHHEGNIR